MRAALEDKTGEGLDSLARAAGIPIWLRKLPPEAFAEPIPALPNSPEFRRQVANYIPRSPKLAPIWLRAIADAHAWGNDELSIWIAREVSHRSIVKLRGLRLIAVWAWLSANGPDTAVLPYAPRWTSSMRYETALRWAGAWRLALELHMCLGDEPIEDMWLGPGRESDYEFVPLQSKQDILDEASYMKNCLRTYGVRVARNRCKLWSVRTDGKRVATLEIACRGPDPCPRIVQIRTAGDGQASPEIWWAAHRWVRTHNLADINTKALSWQEAPIDRKRWITYWRPYWLGKRRIPSWLPLSPSLSALNEL